MIKETKIQNQKLQSEWKLKQHENLQTTKSLSETSMEISIYKRNGTDFKKKKKSKKRNWINMNSKFETGTTNNPKNKKATRKNDQAQRKIKLW